MRKMAQMLMSSVTKTNGCGKESDRRRQWRSVVLAVGATLTLLMTPHVALAGSSGTTLGSTGNGGDVGPTTTGSDDTGGCDNGGGSGGGNTGGSSGGNDNGGGCDNGSTPPCTSCQPVYYRYGAVMEQVTDLALPSPGVSGVLSRSYSSMVTGATSLGNKWVAQSADVRLTQQGSNLAIFAGAASEVLFTLSGSTYTPPAGASNLTLTADSTNHQYILVDVLSNKRTTFNDFTVTNTALRGRPKEVSTLQWNTQGNSGFIYAYNTNGTISQITSPTNQDYNIVYTYSGTLITTVQVKDASSNLLAQVDYTYYQNVTSPSTDLGTTNDLVQVKVSQKATTDPSGTLSIVRYTQYRYAGTTS